MRQHGTRNKVLDRLLATLANAESGSRELDIITSFVLGETSGETGKMVELLVEEGYPWDIVSELLDRELPAYTSALDAAIPGENIVLAVYSTRRQQWGAVHRTADGQHVWRWAATECLARRLAALSALAPTRAFEGDGTTAETGVPPANKDTASIAAGADTGPAEEESFPPEAAPEGGTDSREETETEWKILF